MDGQSVSGELLQLFWPLAEGKDDDRITAADKLVGIIKDKQAKNKELCNECKYCVKRLVRGLASNRKWARVGYSTALTQLLREIKPVSVKYVMDLAEEELPVIRADAKSEKSASILGRALLCVALIQADKVVAGEDVSRVTKMLQYIVDKKAPLHLLVSQTLKSLILKVPSEVFTEHMWPLLESQLSTGFQKCTADQLMLLMATCQQHKEVVSKSFLKSHWGCKKLLSPKTVSSIMPVLLRSTSDHPILHGLSLTVVEAAVHKPDFRAALMEALAGPVENGPPQHKYLCFHIVTEALAKCTTIEQVEEFLTEKVVHSLLHLVLKKNHVLNAVAKKTVNRISEIGQGYSDGYVKYAVIKALLKNNFKFDAVTSMSAISNIVHTFDSSTVKEWTDMLKENALGMGSFIDSDADEDETSQVQKQAISYLVALTTHPAVVGDQQFHHSILKFLFAFAYFNIKRPIPDVVECTMCPSKLIPPVRQSFQTAVSKYLNKLSTIRSGQKSKCLLNYIECLKQIVQYAAAVMSKVDMLTPMQDETKEEWDSMLKAVNNIEKKHIKSGDLGEGHAFILLFLQLGLQLFSQPQAAVDALQDLHICSEKAFSSKKTGKKNKGSEPAWIEVVTDMLLSMMSQDSHLIRITVVTVFKTLASHLNTDACDLVLQALHSDPSSEDGMLGFEEDEDDDDVEEMEVDEEEEEEEEGSEEESEDEEESSEEEEEYDPVIDDEMRARVKVALGDAAGASEDEEDDDEDSEPDMDDEAMFKFDDALAAAFKGMSRGKQNKDKKMQGQQLKAYRLRCLDMVNAIVESQPPVSMLLQLLRPLLEIVEAGYRSKERTDEGNRASAILGSVFKMRKFPSDSQVDMESLPETVDDLMTYSTKVSGIPVVKVVADSIVFIVRVMAGMGADEAGAKSTKNADLNKILDIMRKALTSFCTKRDTHYNHMLFHTLLEKAPVLLWPLSQDLLTHSLNKEIRIFCRTQTFSMLAVMIRKNNISNLEDGCWDTFLERVNNEILQDITTYLFPEQKMRYVHECLLFLHRCMSVADKLDEMWQKEDFIDCVKKMRQTFRKDVGQICNPILRKLGVKLDPIQSGPPQPKAKKRPLPETSESSPSGKKAKHKAPPVNDTRDSDSEEESEDDMMEQNGSAGTEEGSDAEDESHSDTSDEEQEAEKKNFTKVKTKDSKKAKKTKHKMTTNGKSVASKVSVQQQSQKHKKMKGKKK